MAAPTPPYNLNYGQQMHDEDYRPREIDSLGAKAGHAGGYVRTFADRISNIDGGFIEMVNHLENIADRVFGPVPQDASNAAKDREPSSDTDKVFYECDRLANTLRRLQNTVARFSQL